MPQFLAWFLTWHFLHGMWISKLLSCRGSMTWGAVQHQAAQRRRKSSLPCSCVIFSKLKMWNFWLHLKVLHTWKSSFISTVPVYQSGSPELQDLRKSCKEADDPHFAWVREKWTNVAYIHCGQLGGSGTWEQGHCECNIPNADATCIRLSGCALSFLQFHVVPLKIWAWWHEYLPADMA